jgi:hypothetical protein
MVFITLSPKIWFVPEKFQIDEPLSLAFLILKETPDVSACASKNKHSGLRH